MIKLVNQLTNQGYTCVDMHVHTVYSKDSLIRVNSLLKNIKKKNIGVAITEHNNIGGVLAAQKLKKKEQFIIPGIEICCACRTDVLAYFYSWRELKEFHDKHITPNLGKKLTEASTLGFLELFKILKDYNCVTSAPHPFFYKTRRGVYYLIKNEIFKQDIIKKFGSVEVLNSTLSHLKNQKAMEMAQKFKMPVTAGSDAHVTSLIGKALTVSDASNVNDFLDSIKNKKNFITGDNIGLLAKLKPGMAILTKYLRNSKVYAKVKNKVFNEKNKK